MIEYITGNLLESEAQALVNTVNTEGVMGKGLALQFREAFPNNYKLYRQACKEGKVRIGEMFITQDSNLLSGTHLIVNFPTKGTWRKPSSYSYIEQGLQALKREIVERGITSIAIPPLGSHNGGLDWNVVKPMIVQALEDLDCRIIIYEPSAAIQERINSERVKLTPARGMLLYVLCGIAGMGEFISEFNAEKSAYFLERFGAYDQFRLTFKKATYGPYSGRVRYVLHYLNGSYLTGMHDMSQRPFDPLWLMKDTRTLVNEYLDKPENETYRAIAQRTLAFIEPFCSDYGVELLATIDYILMTTPSLAHWREDDEEKVIDILCDELVAWNERKQRMFNDRRNVTLALQQVKLLPVPTDEPIVDRRLH